MRKLISIAGDWMRQRLLERAAPGVRVLKSRWPLSVQTVNADGETRTSVAGPSGGAADLALMPVGEAGWKVCQVCLGEIQFESPPMQQREAEQLYKEMQAQLLANAPPGISVT